MLYLTTSWGMKGYDAVVFPREGEPVLVCLDGFTITHSAEPASRLIWIYAVGIGAFPDSRRPGGSAIPETLPVAW